MAMLLSNYSNALKEVLLPYIQDNFPKQTILLDQMKRNSGVTFLNDEFIAPVRTSRHPGIANLANDGGSVVTSSGGSVGRGTVPVKVVSGAFDISKLAIDATKTSKGAVESALEFQARTMASDFARHINRQLYGGSVGVVAQLKGSVGTSTAGKGTASVTFIDSSVDDGRMVDVYGSINGDISPVKYLQVGQHVGIGTAGNATGTIDGITGTASAGTWAINFTGYPATAANDSIYILDGSHNTPGSCEFSGIRDAVASDTAGSYAGLARTTTGWTATFGSASEALTLSRMEDAYLAAKEYAQMDDKYIILVNKSLYKKYGDILTSMRRTVQEADLLGGWTGLEFAAGAGRVGVFLDYDVPDGEVIVLNLDTWTLCQVSDLQWLEDPNGGGLLRLQNTITYQATMVWFANVMCLCPAANAKETRKTD